MNTGKILTVSGPVVDCGFETGQLPAIREALHVTLHGEVRVMEVVQQLSATRVRCVLLGASEQLSRGMPVKATGTGIQVPVGEATLGRMFNVLGEPIDGEGALPSETPQWEIHRKPPVFSEQRPATELLETGIKVIDPNDFNYIDKTPVNPLEIPLYIVKAFIKRIDLMLVIMFAGGAFHILTKTGALHAVVAKMAKIFSTRVYLFLPILTLVFGLICTTQGVNLFIAFAPIMVMMAFAMGLDSITGASIILLGGAIGFSTGPLNINTTIVAQKIAGLPLYSGVGYRFICFAVFYVITNIYLIRYALKIQKHPELSPMYEIDKTSEFRNAADLDSFGKLDARKIFIMLVFFASLILIVYGGIKLDWDMSETASVFLALAVIEGVLGGFGPSAISKEFLEGCKKMLGAAFIIGMAQAISSIMNAGHITDTVVHALANGLNFVPTILLGPAMLLANTIINVFLTSGSGQAAAVIPILAPLADLVGVTRQTAILSFNFGDGFCNYVLPTSTALMGIISAVNIPYDRWMKFMWKLFLIWLAVGSVMLMIAQAIHLGPM